MNEKNTLSKQLKDLEFENYEQNRSIDQAVNSENFQKKIKYLMEDLRMWRDKNFKLETQLQHTQDARIKQEQKMHELEDQNVKIKSRLERLKAQSPTNARTDSAAQQEKPQSNLKPEIDALHKEMQQDQLI